VNWTLRQGTRLCACPMRRLLTATLLLLLLLPAARAVAGDNPSDLLVDACRDENVDGTYSQKTYRRALDQLPADSDQYTACRDVINRARLAALNSRRSSSGNGGGGGQTGSSGGGSGGGGNSSGAGSGGSSRSGGSGGGTKDAAPCGQRAPSTAIAAPECGLPAEIPDQRLVLHGVCAGLEAHDRAVSRAFGAHRAAHRRRSGHRAPRCRGPLA